MLSLPLKNHKVLNRVSDFGNLWTILNKQKSIYFAPANRVMPCRFFVCYLWKIKKLEEHILAGNFYEVTPKKSIQENRIRKQLIKCIPEIVTFLKK